MTNKLWTVQTCIETTWSDDGQKLVNLTPAEEKELDIWIMSHQTEFCLDIWDFNVGFSDSAINLQFYCLPYPTIYDNMNKIREKIESIIAKRKEVN